MRCRLIQSFCYATNSVLGSIPYKSRGIPQALGSGLQRTPTDLGGKKPQVPPLRSFGAPVGMTILLSPQGLQSGILAPATKTRNLAGLGLRAAADPHRSRGKKPQVPPLRSFGAPVGMTILLQGKSILRRRVCGLNKIVIPTGAQRSGGTCGFSSGRDTPWRGVLRRGNLYRNTI